MLAVSSPSYKNYIRYLRPAYVETNTQPIRRTDVVDRGLLDMLNTAIGTGTEVRSMEELSDGAFGRLMLDSWSLAAANSLNWR